MARAVNKLTAVKVAREKTPGRYGDGGGLYLLVDPNGSRRWQMIFRQNGNRGQQALTLNVAS